MIDAMPQRLLTDAERRDWVLTRAGQLMLQTGLTEAQLGPHSPAWGERETSIREAALKASQDECEATFGSARYFCWLIRILSWRSADEWARGRAIGAPHGPDAVVVAEFRRQVDQSCHAH
jgi:hypothetical protein